MLFKINMVSILSKGTSELILRIKEVPLDEYSVNYSKTPTFIVMLPRRLNNYVCQAQHSLRLLV